MTNRKGYWVLNKYDIGIRPQDGGLQSCRWFTDAAVFEPHKSEECSSLNQHWGHHSQYIPLGWGGGAVSLDFFATNGSNAQMVNILNAAVVISKHLKALNPVGPLTACPSPKSN